MRFAANDPVLDDAGVLPFAEAMARAQAVVADGMARAFRDRDGALDAAMQYALVGGKALRAFLVIEGARLHGITPRFAGLPALAIECVHAYSLIHDDLPCMDDDDLRRGQPTVHIKWDEAVAVLAGDALQALAFELLCHPSIGDDRVRMQLIRGLAQSGGRDGMVGGQMLDIEAESTAEPYDLDQIIATQKGKTGALIGWSCTAGAILAEADQAPLATYGEALGLAFQIADDVLDVEGDAATVGKAVGKDADAGKATFVSLLGLDGAKRRAEDLVQEACDALNSYGEAAETLKAAARFVIDRTH